MAIYLQPSQMMEVYLLDLGKTEDPMTLTWWCARCPANMHTLSSESQNLEAALTSFPDH